MRNKQSKITESDVIEIVRNKAKQLLKQPNISSVGVGFKEEKGLVTNKLSVQFTVNRKFLPDNLEAEGLTSLPTEFETENGIKVPVDVVERSYKTNYEIVSDPEQELLSEDLTTHQKYRARHDPVFPGISVSNVKGTAGTIGAIVYDNSTGQPYILSNWHVLHGLDGVIGDSVVQPGPYDDGSTSNNIVGKLISSHLGLAGDCAISSIESRSFSEEIFGLNIAPKRTAKVNLGDKVVKSGRTTGVTYGIVKRVNVIVEINYGGDVGTQDIGGFEIGVNTEKPPMNGEVSMGGDSGSLWLIDDKNNSDIAVGLHFAGESDPSPTAEHAIACNIHSVLSKLKVSFIEADESLLTDEELWNDVLSRLDTLSTRIARLEGAISLSLGERTGVSQLEGLRIYGNWCGPGHGSGVPVDEVDRACMNHDKCYDKKGYLNCDCDGTLIKELDKALIAQNVKPAGREAAQFIRTWFKLQPCVYHVGGIPIPGGTGGTTYVVKSVLRDGNNIWKKIKNLF